MRRIMLCFRVLLLRRMLIRRARPREHGKKNMLVEVVEFGSSGMTEGEENEEWGWQTAAENGVINEERQYDTRSKTHERTWD